MTNPIEVAVLPLKQDAIARAEKEALALVEKVRKDLEAHNWDMAQAAPYPNSMRDSRNTYHEKLGKYKLYSYLVTHKACSRRMNEPDYVEMSEERIARFVKECEEQAAFQYDAFVAKLKQKIGECRAAVLDGNHIWGYSILTVELLNGEQQRWKTQQIVNVSKLGKLFNQWPTRKVK